MPKDIERFSLDNVKDTVTRKRKALIDKLKKEMGYLSTRKPMSDYDTGYNACLDDCLGILEDNL